MRKSNLVLLLGLFCAGKISGAAAEDVLITQYTTAVSGAPFGIAIDQGYFKKRGVDITGVVSGQGGGNSVRAIIASDLGFGESTVAAAISAIKEGQDLKIVYMATPLIGKDYIITMKSSPIKTLQDLSGKRWGISNPKSLGEMIAMMTLETAGLPPNTLQRIAFGSIPGVLTALENGVIDVQDLVSNTYEARGGDKRYNILARVDTDLPHMAQAVGIATDDLIQKNPGKLRDIIAARREAVEFIYRNPDEAAKIMDRDKVYLPIQLPQLANFFRYEASVKYWSEGYFDMTSLTNVVRAMKYVGLLDRDIDLEPMIDRSFLPKDLLR
jgi:NitT/TauT family transport system substrate-binding protein